MSEDDDDDYAVGYGKPPKGARFKKGQSGNPSGKPKGVRSLKADLSEELAAKVTVLVNGRERTLTKQRLLVMKTVNEAAKGNLRATGRVMEMVKGVGLIVEPTATNDDALSTDDAEIIAQALRRRAGGNG